jgi:WD40 repeat protein
LQSASSKGVKFVSFLKDAENFVRRHRTTIEQYPLQTYGTALALSPTRSDVKNMFWRERLSFIESVQGVGDAWDACLQAFESPTFQIPLVAFSTDGKVLVLVTSWRVQLWDLATGGCKLVLEERVLEEGVDDHMVCAVAFSPDGNTLTTAARSAVRFWDVTTEACKKTLDFPDGSISATAFSLDGACLAVASGRTICLWDTAGMVCKKTLDDVADYKVTSIALSPDGKLLAACTDRGVQIWDIAAGVVKQELPKSPEDIQSAVFSPDSKTLALGSRYQTAIWDFESATVSHKSNEDYLRPSMRSR